MKEKEIKLENIEASPRLGGAGKVVSRGEGGCFDDQLKQDFFFWRDGQA